MADTAFLLVLAGYLGLATTLLYRSPMHGWGFPMFILVYPLFLVAYFFSSAKVVMLAWLGLAFLNMPFQLYHLKKSGVLNRFIGVLTASLFLWPVQFAAAINSSESDKDIEANKAVNRDRIGPLPATISGTVSFAHHHGTEEGHDSVWLEEYGDLDFMTDAETFDEIGIAEGKKVSMVIDERDAPEGMAEDKVLWIVKGADSP